MAEGHIVMRHPLFNYHSSLTLWAFMSSLLQSLFQQTYIWDIKEWDAPCLLCHLVDQRPPEMERAHNIIHANPFISSVSMSSILRGAARMIKQINWKSSDCIHLLSTSASDSSWTLMVKNKYYHYHHLLLSLLLLSSPVYMQDLGWAKEPKMPI